MKNVPTKIYLEVDPDNQGILDFEEVKENTTWRTKQIFITDIEYILASEYIKLSEALSAIYYLTEGAPTPKKQQQIRTILEKALEI